MQNIVTSRISAFSLVYTSTIKYSAHEEPYYMNMHEYAQCQTPYVICDLTSYVSGSPLQSKPE
jgi:hypothetical protein